jgi:hypothetical protein
MTRFTGVHGRIQTIDDRLARLRSERLRLLARADASDRKRDTRQKILIGAAALAAVEHEGLPSMGSRAELLAWLDARLTRPHDRAAFDLPRRQGAGAHTPAFGRKSKTARSEAAVKDADQREAPRSGAERP